MYAYIDRKKKFPVTTLLRAIGYGSDKLILDLFGLSEEIQATKTALKKVSGRKLAARVLRTWVEDFVDEDTGEVVSIDRNEVLLERDSILSDEDIDLILESGTKSIILHREDVNVADYSIIYNTLQKDNSNSEKEAVEVIYRQLRNTEAPDEATAREVIHGLFFSDKRYDLGEVGRYRINKKLGLSIAADKIVLTTEDIINIVKYLINLINSKAEVDDIDHLSNRRVRTVGEQLYSQFGVGLSRMARTIRERMNIRDNEVFTPTDLINVRTLSSVINSFFGTNQLSQFMDQTNPLAELTHKRRLSALGPGGLSRERAGFEVRDVHYTHYGRLCTIETPEGPNIGLISSLCVHAKVNGMGFLETPYRKAANGKVSMELDDVVFLTAEEEDEHNIAQANAPLDDNGNFINDRVKARFEGDFPVLEPKEITYMDVAPNQIVSVAASLIPFLEHDDANRALMGSNMQRQAVPLLKAEAPLVGTGVEQRAAYDSGDMIVSPVDGEVVEVTGDRIVVKEKDANRKHTFTLAKFERSNQGTAINQKPIVREGDKVKAGDVLADGPSTDHGELALGRNLLVAFMPWQGHNYEDAISISERLVKEDILTSIHIEEHEIDARDTKLGAEEITRDIPNVAEEVLANLDEDGIIRIGAEVGAGDYLVGKVTPKGETELTPEERLLRAIFGEKAREVRDTSLKVPHGESGKVIAVKVFRRSDGYDLAPGVNELVRVYVAKARKVSEGDKLAGRHGNKGVIAKILPEEDMPFLPDGTPVDIILSPLGVPSRMNLGQVLETHLGWAAAQGWQPLEIDSPAAGGAEPWTKVASPVFDGAKEHEIMELLKNTRPNRDGERLVGPDGKAILYDGRTGEPFDTPITVGYIYMLKLVHLVDDKIHARSTGPYSMITQQPLGGKAQFGGQRFGEMEVWALEAYGAAYALQELLTIKSDDVQGRVKVYEAIVKGANIPEPGIPESFRVLVKEMQSLALSVEMLSAGEEVELRELEEDAYRPAESLGIDLSRPERPESTV